MTPGCVLCLVKGVALGSGFGYGKVARGWLPPCCAEADVCWLRGLARRERGREAPRPVLGALSMDKEQDGPLGFGQCRASNGR